MERAAGKEFLVLMASMMCIMALYIDAMLPALYQIGIDLDALEQNRYQWVITAIIIGMGAGQLIYGPLSDTIGRRPTVFIGFVILLIGTLISILSTSFEWMLVGRVLQGVGAAGPRVMMTAIIRDQHSGPEMARVLSIVMTLFIFIPIVAPLLGQLVLLFSGWRAVFGLLAVLAVITLVWFALRQPETLKAEYRRPLAFTPVVAGMKEVLTTRSALAYTAASGLVYASLIGFLTSIQGVLQEIYNVGNLFAVYFALMAFSVGVASYLNSRIVHRYNLRGLVIRVLGFLSLVSLAEFAVIRGFDLQLSLTQFVILISVSTFCFGLLFGNINALAMQPFGHMAGIASGIVGATTMLIGATVGTLIGFKFDGTLGPLLLGFGLTSGLAVLLILSQTRSEPMSTAAEATR